MCDVEPAEPCRSRAGLAAASRHSCRPRRNASIRDVRVGLHLVEDVGVEVGRRGHAGVTEDFHDGPHVGPLHEQNRCGGVTEGATNGAEAWWRLVELKRYA